MNTMNTMNNPLDHGAALLDARDAISCVLSQMRELLLGMTPAHYVQSPVGPAKSSIAAHVRHCLDHVRTLVDSIGACELDYDHRARGTPIERDPLAAIDEITSLQTALANLPAIDPFRDITLRAQVMENGPSLAISSTPLREFVFVLSHTIHHGALIAVMARLLDVDVPAKFGYAPATLTHESACAR